MRLILHLETGRDDGSGPDDPVKEKWAGQQCAEGAVCVEAWRGVSTKFLANE